MQQYELEQVDELKKVYVTLRQEGAIFSDTVIRTPEDALRVLGNEIKNMDREFVYSINLRADNTPINVMIAGIGDESGSLCSPASLIRAAILSNATSMMLIHNHTSGDLQPSKADIKMADKMIQVCQLHDIDFLDSVIVAYGKEKCYSMKRKGTCNFYRDGNEYSETVEKLPFAQRGTRQAL